MSPDNLLPMSPDHTSLYLSLTCSAGLLSVVYFDEYDPGGVVSAVCQKAIHAGRQPKEERGRSAVSVRDRSRADPTPVRDNRAIEVVRHPVIVGRDYRSAAVHLDHRISQNLIARYPMGDQARSDRPEENLFWCFTRNHETADGHPRTGRRVGSGRDVGES